jgi:nitrate/nitrite-specific signal transduction histidine kinase
MLSKREILLLHVLVWVVVAAAAGIGFYLQLERRADAVQKIGALREQMSKFGARAADQEALSRQKEQLGRELERDQGRYYAAQEMDPYRFGIIIRELLLRDGLAISRYQTQEVMGQNLLEFAVSGNALGLARFLQRVSESPKRWSVPFLSISAGERGRVQAVFRVGYESIDEVAP